MDENEDTISISKYKLVLTNMKKGPTLLSKVKNFIDIKTYLKHLSAYLSYGNAYTNEFGMSFDKKKKKKFGKSQQNQISFVDVIGIIEISVDVDSPRIEGKN